MPLIMLPLHLFSTFLFLFLFLLASPVLSNNESVVANAKPECPDHCGDLQIPYPFGVGSDCSYDPYFTVGCNSISSPKPKAYLSIMNEEIEVIEIRINESAIRVKYPHPIASRCDWSGIGINVTKHSKSLNLSGTPYMLSSYRNMLTAFGCDDMVLQFNGTSVLRSCSAFCSDTRGRGNCSSYNSIGCCQEDLDEDMNFVGAELVDLSGRLGRRKLFPCSYAFIQERGDDTSESLSYPLYYLDNSTTLLNDNWASTTSPPVMRLNWIIDVAQKCSSAKKKSTTYACRDDNSACNNYDVTSTGPGGGYTCNCVQGFEGNPYLTGGCQRVSFSSSIAKHGCRDQCGDVSIPFPFGVGLNCSLGPSFDILCNTSTDHPKPYLRALNSPEIIEINSSKIIINYPDATSTCYSFSDGIVKQEIRRSLTLDLSRSQYSVSDDNWIIAIGCDDMVVAVFGEDNRTSIRNSCTNICSKDPTRYDSSVFCYYQYRTRIDGCCRVSIPRGTTYLEANMTDLYGRWPRTINVSCSYAFLQYNNDGELDIYPFLNNSTRTFDKNPYSKTPILALEWRIGAVNCKEAQQDMANYACANNTDCVDFDAAIGGYLCNCSKGYQGNPYLHLGCQDINECANISTIKCYANSICINTPGSYLCSCPKGYSGDGTLYGTGCIRSPLSKAKMIILTGIGSGLGLIMILSMCFWLYKFLQKRKLKIAKDKFFKRNGGLLLLQQTNQGVLGNTKIFTSKELEVATDHFNESRILGHGGQGTVYKGMLSDGKIVAIKKSKLVEGNQVQQFINEVAILSQINHRNVVKLLGCCLETEVPLLIYEYMPNGTLFELIHDPNNEFPVPWNMRLKMATDIAGALAYLHYASSMPIYHRDIKSSNILLDEKYVVKVSDFGTSRSISADQTHLTTLVKGTFGYLDPEYFQSSQFTEKSDVYSFGVVLVELLTGQRPISFDKIEEERGLATRFLKCMEENSLYTILDTQVWEQGKKEEVIQVARLAQRCLNLKGKMRPTMKEVATELESFRMSQMNYVVKDDEFEEVRGFEEMPTRFPHTQHSWTSTSYKSVSASSSDSHPLMFASL